MEAGLPRLAVGLTHVTQALLNAEVSVATAGAAQAGYFLFPSCIRGVIPGQLGAGLHHSDGDKQTNKQTNKHRCQPSTTLRQEDTSSSSSPAGEEGDDGEAGVVRVGEDVLQEEVRLAAVLWEESRGQRSGVAV